MSGKGDKRRPCDEKRYAKNWERCFKKKKSLKSCKGIDIICVREGAKNGR